MKGFLTNKIKYYKMAPKDYDLRSQKEQIEALKIQDILAKKEFLADLDIHNIARVFSSFAAENRTILIPIGFPQAGKSLLLSSLVHYAVKGKETLFRAPIEEQFPYNKGRKTVDEMVRYFESGRLYGASAMGILDLIGIRMEPSKSKLPVLNLAFLDLSGEDIKRIKTNEGAEFTDKINAVFKGLAVDDTPIIFALITPYLPVVLPGETLEKAHNKEDALHFDFLNYIKINQPHLLRNSKFFVIVSQWDKNPDQNQKIDEYIRLKRPSVYNYVKDTNVIWGQYSIGKLLESNLDGVIIQEIIRINYDYPARFWNKLYNICTNKNLNSKSIFEKWFV